MTQTTEQLINELQPLFNPQSIALIGASIDFSKPNGRPLELLMKHGYRGCIYPVNPKYAEIAGLKCYPSLNEITGEIDMAIIGVAAARVPDVLRACGLRGVRSAVVFSSGFAEVGAAGVALQQEIAEIARQYNIKMCGPNCLGLLNTANGVMATFATVPTQSGRESSRLLGFITQSGAFGAVIYMMAQQRGVGFNYFVSVGNEASLEFCDFLEYMLLDPETKVIGGYMEGAKDGVKLRRVAEKALQAGKPVILMKVGKSAVGARAAGSHTGSLAGADRVYDAFFRQTGIIRIDSMEDLVALVNLFAGGKLPAGGNVGIVSTSGGAGVLMADKCDEFGLVVPDISPHTREHLESLLPGFASALNPVDITGQIMNDPGLLKQCLETMTKDPRIHSLIAFFALSGPRVEDMARDIIQVYNQTDKPMIVITWYASGNASNEHAYNTLKQSRVPIIEEPVQAVRALASLVHFASARQRHRDEARCEPCRSGRDREKTGILLRQPAFGERESKALLAHCGIPVAKGKAAADPEQALQAARDIGYPVVLKADAPRIRHKTEAGAVRLNITGDDELAAAFEAVTTGARQHSPGAEIRGVLVEEMLPPGTEMIVGALRDPVFGPTVMVGLGGIFVEALEDVAFRVAPITRRDARDMLAELKGGRILQGLRGRPAADIDAVIDVLLKVSALAVDFQDEIAEIDINPLLVYPVGQGVRAADALVVKKE